MIVGTAGHVDHGKTSLIQALTGIATDRLKEEQARGLTIEAGYAYPSAPPAWPQASLGFIDVPGHERFIANMLSGAAGIQAMLLVVAADDGIMPQTLEHARILELLGVSEAWVALTKCDRVTPARVAAVRDEIDTWLGRTPFAGSPIFTLSSRTGQGIDALSESLWARAARHVTPVGERAFRLAVDRVFSKRGAGTVVTGTVRSGTLRVGETVRLLPSGLSARVRGLRGQDREVDAVGRGERCAINLSGAEVARDRLTRGDWVVGEASRVSGRDRLDVRLRLLPEASPLKHWSSVHLHHASAHVTGRVSLLQGETLLPGATALAQLVLDSPLQATHGDTLILRDQGAQATLGGARVLDVSPPRRGARKPERLRELEASVALLSGDDAPPLSLWWQRVSREAPVDIAALAANLDLSPATLRESAEAAGWQTVSGGGSEHALRPELRDAWHDSVVERLAERHAEEPAMRGVEIDRLRRISLPRLPAELFRPLLSQWLTRGEIVQHGPFVALASHRAALGEADARHWQALQPLLAQVPFEPPRVRDLAVRLVWEEREVRRVLHSCALLGEVYQLRHDHFFLAHHVAALADIIRQLDGLSAEGATAAAFRDRVGCGRKLAVAILEFFDRIGFTRRVGDGHRVIRDDMLFI